MTTDPWVLAVDFGTSFAVAAARVGDRMPEVLEIDGERRIPSVIVVLPDGELRFGRAAETLSASNPGSTLRAMKARLGDASPVVLGTRPYPVVGLVAAFLQAIADQVIEQMGSRPAGVRLTHPASWNQPLVQRFAEAAVIAGLDGAVLVPEPIAAAAAYAADGGLDAGQCIVVYDLGGGTFDCAVVRGGDLAVVGQASGDGSIGGELFDELMMNVIGEQLEPDVWNSILVDDDTTSRRVRLNLRNEARRAKEALSSSPYVDVAIGLPAGLAHVRLTRADFDEIARPYLEETVAITQRCVNDAGLRRRDLSAVALVGGASRSPLVAELIASAFPGIAIRRRGDPKASVAIGAALADGMSRAQARAAADPPTRPPPVTTLAPPPPPPPPPLPPPAEAPPQGFAGARRRRTMVAAALTTLVAIGATWFIVEHSAGGNETRTTSSEVGSVLTVPRPEQTTGESSASSAPPAGSSSATSTNVSAPSKDPRLTGHGPIASIVQSFVGHTSPVTSAVFSPDGSKLATGATDHTAKIWDVATGSMLHNLADHTGDVNWVAFDPTGTRLVTASSDGTARVWNVDTGEPLAVLQHDLSSTYFVVNTAEFSHDGSMIVTAGNDATARIWDASTGAPLHVLTHGSFVFTAWFSPDDTTVLTASLDDTAGVWAVASGERIETLDGHTDKVDGAVFSPDGTMIVTASADGTAKVWDAATGTPIATLMGHVGPVRSAMFSPDGSRVVTSSDDRSADVWDSRTGTRLFALSDTAEVRAATFTPDGSEIVTLSADYVGRIWDATTGSPIAELQDVVNDMSFSPDGRTIVTPSIGSASAVIWSMG